MITPMPGRPPRAAKRPGPASIGDPADVRAMPRIIGCTLNRVKPAPRIRVLPYAGNWTMYRRPCPHRRLGDIRSRITRTSVPKNVLAGFVTSAI